MLRRSGKCALRYPFRRRAERGQAIIESIASIILFALLLALVMSITVYLYFQQALVTCAREGARMASLNTTMATDEAAGKAEIVDYVEDEVRSLTGQSFDNGEGDVDVSGPSESASQTPGERTVTVTITYNMQNPLGIEAFINALGGDGSAFGTIPVAASATMRYEE